MIGEHSRASACLVGALLAAIVFALAGGFPSPKPKPASTLKCPEAQLAVEDNSTGAQVVTGCGKSDVIVMEGKGKMTSLRERSSFELSCPDEQIDLKVLPPTNQKSNQRTQPPPVRGAVLLSIYITYILN